VSLEHRRATIRPESRDHVLHGCPPLPYHLPRRYRLVRRAVATAEEIVKVELTEYPTAGTMMTPDAPLLEQLASEYCATERR
jgi:hypothetical protein